MRKEVIGGENNVCIYYDLISFPSELEKHPKWRELTLNFQGDIDLPKEVFLIEAQVFKVWGKVPIDKKKEIEDLQIKLYFEKEVNLIVNSIWPFDLEAFFEYSEE